MQSLIIYYSHSGNTAYVAEKFADTLAKEGRVVTCQLEREKSQISFFRQILNRFFPVFIKISLLDSPVDLKDYDLLCLGVPVWVGSPAPIIMKYLQVCKNLTGKKVICFYVYNINESAKKCQMRVEDILRKKGVVSIVSVFVSWLVLHNEAFLEKAIPDAVAEITSR